jgi:competence protein ComEC
VAGIPEGYDAPRRRPDPDPDGVSLVVAVTVGILAGTRLAATVLLAATVMLAVVLVATLLLLGSPNQRPGHGWRPGQAPEPAGRGHGSRRRGRGQGSGLGRRGQAPAPGESAYRGQRWRPGGPSAAVGALGLATLAATGVAVAGLRAGAVQGALLPRWAGRGATVALQGTVAEEPSVTRYGGLWVVVSVRRVQFGGQAWRTRERAGAFLPRSAGPLAVGDRLLLRAAVEPSDRADPLGGEPAVVLRRPHVESRTPARSLPLRVSEAVRASARRRVLADLPRERAGLLVGMALGDTSLLGADLQAAFRAAGLTHLVAVSGQNVAIVVAAGLGVAVGLGAGRPALAATGIFLVVLFALLTRWEPSVLRASAMAVLTLLGVAAGRGPGGRRALCLAVLLLLLANPALVASLGFQLSVAATAGVLWLGPLAAKSLPARLPEMVRTTVGVSLGAQAGALPLLALALGRVSLAGLATNLVAVPLAAVPMLLGVVAAGTAVVAPPLATLACRLADPFLTALVALATRSAAVPGASVSLSGPVRLLPALVVLACAAVARRAAATLDNAAEHQRRLHRSAPRVEGPWAEGPSPTGPPKEGP